MKVYTIGFTQKSAEKFFGLLRSQKIKNLVDIRLNNSSQLAGFAKKNDLIFFLKELCAIEYIYIPELTPTKNILDPYKKGIMSWQEYEDKFMNLMAQRRIECIDKSIIQDGCLLCSEHKPHHCHRRLVVEYLKKSWNSELEIKHLF